MKHSILIVGTFTAIVFGLLNSCDNSSERVEKAQKDLNEAEQELKEANEAYLIDVDNYRNQTADRISSNEKIIADFNLRIDEQKKEAKDDYKKKIAELDQKNTDMKRRMDNYRADGKQKWELFKSEFSEDMYKLQRSFDQMKVDDMPAN